MKKRYFVEQFLSEEYMHGGIGCVDAERILKAKGFAPILFPFHNNFSLWAKVSRLYFLVKTFLLTSDAIVVFLFPLYAKLPKRLVKWLRRKKTIDLICFIADINGLKDGDEILLKKEISFLRHFNYFIVHNDRMSEWVKTNISADAVVASIEFFDFLTKPVNRPRQLSKHVVFAGNLAKSLFLEKLGTLKKTNPTIFFHLYGPGKTKAMQENENSRWEGMGTAYQLPDKLEGSFGLLWDGDAVDKPGGSLGHYMHYISHHKLSLYIISKLPVIAPVTAGSAALIGKYKIGILTDSLDELEASLNKVSEADYQQMQNNMGILAENISRGQCLSNALDEIIKQV